MEGPALQTLFFWPCQQRTLEGDSGGRVSLPVPWLFLACSCYQGCEGDSSEPTSQGLQLLSSISVAQGSNRTLSKEGIFPV